jgi:cyclopropane fatty-acyl-phospholipid synthase-like methyltransferase
MSSPKPYSLACDQNCVPILTVLRDHFADRKQVLEIGSGTGQHAVYFAAAMPRLTWQTSDLTENLPGIKLWLNEAALPNTPTPLTLDVNGPWPKRRFDAVFTANTLHIMSWPDVEALFTGLPDVMANGAKLAIYGPFNYGGCYTSQSNAAFDRSLRAQAQRMGIRDFETVNELAQTAGLQLLEDRAMPANNRCLMWQQSEVKVVSNPYESDEADT